MSAPLSVSPAVGLAPGTIIGGRYRIDGFLGAGGMGVVLSATHLELDAPVAIKIVREDLASHELIVTRLLFEARAAARMRGAHVVRVLDVARLDTGAPYIVMERLEGSDLQVALTERGALSVREAVCLVLQACEGLAEAHGLGIIHRDLKPENLFLANTPEGVVLKLLDFGISKNIGEAMPFNSRSTLTSGGSAVGSPYYMSPEQMRAAPNLDGRADIWSLGAILFELLTNRCPFEADTTAALCTKVMLEEAPLLRTCLSSAPAELEAIVRRCLQKDPDARFQTVTELATALRDFTAAEERAHAEDREPMASGVTLRADVAEHASHVAEHASHVPEHASHVPEHASHVATHASPAPEVEDPGEAQPRFALYKTLFALFAVCTLLVIGAISFWHLQARGEEREWRAAQRAAVAELTNRAPVAEAPRAPTAQATAPVNVVVAPSVPAPEPAVTAAPAKVMRAPSHPPTAAAKHAAAPPAEPDNLASRYGL